MGAAAEHHHGMKKGFYNEHSTTQGNAISLCSDILSTAAMSSPLPCDPLQCLHIAEWGCAHGANSIAPVCLIAELIQQRLTAGEGNAEGTTVAAAAAAGSVSLTKQQVQVSHMDVPSNDFSALFACAQEYIDAIERKCPQLHVSSAAVGRSMYSPNFPARSLQLGFSFTCLHWQAKKAIILSRTINPGCTKEHQVLQAHAVADLTNFLQLRAAEFLSGGMLVLCYVGYNEAAPLESMTYHDAAQAVAESMVADGLLQQNELGLMAGPVYFLDEATQRAVYASQSADWELLEFDIVSNTSPKWQDFLDGRISNEEQAAVYVNYWRAIMEHFMKAGLAHVGRSKEQISSILDTFFNRMTAAAMANPQPASYPATRVLLRRRY